MHNLDPILVFKKSDAIFKQFVSICVLMPEKTKDNQKIIPAFYARINIYTHMVSN